MQTHLLGESPAIDDPLHGQAQQEAFARLLLHLVIDVYHVVRHISHPGGTLPVQMAWLEHAGFLLRVSYQAV